MLDQSLNDSRIVNSGVQDVIEDFAVGQDNLDFRVGRAPENYGKCLRRNWCARFAANQVRLISQQRGWNKLGLLHSIFLRWEVRKFELTCPHCKIPASPTTFRQGRYMLGDLPLVCEHCDEGTAVTFWRFEGIQKQSVLGLASRDHVERRIQQAE